MLTITTTGRSVTITEEDSAPVTLVNAEFRWYFYNGYFIFTAGPCDMRALINSVEVNGETPGSEAALNAALAGALPSSGGRDLGYESYAFLLTQESGGAPVATNLTAPLAAGQISWAYLALGVYSGSIAGGFNERAVIIPAQQYGNALIFARKNPEGAGLIITTTDIAGAPADDQLYFHFFEVRIYDEI